MQFLATIKPKKCRVTSSSSPLPENILLRGTFTGFTVELFDKGTYNYICENGCFGKGSHSRGTPKVTKTNEINLGKDLIDETLVLDLEESLFLFHFLKVLEIYDRNGEMLELKNVFEKFTNIKSNFPKTFASYLYLRSKNWIVKSGIKFGGDFLIYKKGPKYYHASFVVFVTDHANRKQKDLQGLHRIAETSDKDCLFLEVSHPEDIDINNCSNFFDNIHRFKISEVIPARLDYKSFVQAK